MFWRFGGQISCGSSSQRIHAKDYRRSKAQTAPQGGNTFSASFNASNNQANGYGYDAAGNMTNDGFHTYTYDPDGNIIQVDVGGSTAQYVYDALNRRVSAKNSSGTVENVFDTSNHRISSWPVGLGYGNEGRLYWDGAQFGFRAYNSSTYFDHRDVTGTLKAHTTNTGALSDTHSSLPWGDGFSTSPSSPPTNQDTFDFANLDYDYETNTDHAQFRQYPRPRAVGCLLTLTAAATTSPILRA
jgi:YD repeat-containing protein